MDQPEGERHHQQRLCAYHALRGQQDPASFSREDCGERHGTYATWSYLQRVKFGANAQPFYVLIDNEGKPLNKSYSYDEDIPKYIEFLQTGLENYKKEK